MKNNPYRHEPESLIKPDKPRMYYDREDWDIIDDEDYEARATTTISLVMLGLFMVAIMLVLSILATFVGS